MSRQTARCLMWHTIANHFFSELCWGRTMVVYTKLQQRKQEESERLRGEGDQIKFTDSDLREETSYDSGKEEESMKVAVDAIFQQCI